MYEEHLSFIQWAKEYDLGDKSMRSRAMHDNWSKLLSCKEVTLNGTKPVEDNLEILKDYLEVL